MVDEEELKKKFRENKDKYVVTDYKSKLLQIFSPAILKSIELYLDYYLQAPYIFEQSLKPYSKTLGNPRSPNIYALLYILFILKTLNIPITPAVLKYLSSWLNDKAKKPIIPINSVQSYVKRLLRYSVLVYSDDLHKHLTVPDTIWHILKIGYLQIEKEIKRRREIYALAKAMFGFAEDELPKSEKELEKLDEKTRYALFYWHKFLKEYVEEGRLHDKIPYDIEDNLVILKPYVHSQFEWWIIRELKQGGLDTYKRLLEGMHEKFIRDANPQSRPELVVEVEKNISNRLLAIDISEDMAKELPNRYSSAKDTFVLDGVIVSVVYPLKFPLFDIVVCEDKHVTLLDPGEAASRTICPKCASGVVYKGTITVPGALATVESLGSSEYRESYRVFIPLPIWDKIRQDFSSRKMFLVAEIPRQVSVSRRKMIQVQFLAIGAKFGRRKVIISEESMSKIERLTRMPTWKILRLFSNTIYDFIYGEEHAKLAALLTAFSQGKDIILRETVRSKTKLYGVLYTLMIGSPQSAKSKILEVTVRYANPIFYDYALLHAGSITVAGIAASYDKETGGLKLGVEPLNHGRIVAYDELDKAVYMDDVIAQLNTIMSEYTVKYHKATFRLTVPAVSAKLFAANLPPKIDYSTIYTPEELVKIIIEPPEETRKRSPLFGKATEPFLSRIDFLVYMPTYLPADQILEFQLKDKEKDEDIDVDKELFTEYIDLIRDKFGQENSATYISKEAEYELMKILRDLKKIQSTFTKMINQPRRLETFFKLARTIAHMHMRAVVKPQDIRDAVAFYLFIHAYPFITVLQNIEGDTTNKLFSYFKNELGDYAKVILTEESSVSGSELPKPKPKKVISSEDELVHWVIELITSKKTITKDELATIIRNAIVSGEAVVVKKNAKWSTVLRTKDVLTIKLYLSEILDRLKYRGIIYEPSPGVYSVSI